MFLERVLSSNKDTILTTDAPHWTPETLCVLLTSRSPVVIGSDTFHRNHKVAYKIGTSIVAVCLGERTAGTH
ncbi:hypothetical protein COCOBI_14-2060 [Coccomyxa sp. Obi]|nr:hypothetical protein COCOBI_14-2060 [Coccomyxa sp. Obi]